MRKQNVLLLWLVLWGLSPFAFTIRNRVGAGVGLSLFSVLATVIVMDVLFLPLAAVGFYLMRWLANVAGAKDFLVGRSALRNVVIVWFGLFIVAFLMPLFR